MANATPSLVALLTVLSPMSATPRSREALVDILRRAHILVNPKLEIQGQVTDAQLNQLIILLDEKPVWKVAAKRVLRNSGG